jgi:nitroreductase
MNVSDAIRARISTRAFLPTPISENDLRSLLDTARWSPSGGNLQPWHIYVVMGDAMQRLKAEVAAEMKTNPMGEAPEFPIYPEGLKEPYRARRFKCGEDMYAAIKVPREDKAGRMMQFVRNFDFFGAPAAFFFTIDRQMGLGQWAHMGMLMQTICLAAEERGLGTCMQEAWATRPTLLRRFLSLPDALRLYCGMAIGHPDHSAPINTMRTERAPVDEIATFVG